MVWPMIMHRVPIFETNFGATLSSFHDRRFQFFFIFSSTAISHIINNTRRPLQSVESDEKILNVSFFKWHRLMSRSLINRSILLKKKHSFTCKTSSWNEGSGRFILLKWYAICTLRTEHCNEHLLLPSTMPTRVLKESIFQLRRRLNSEHIRFYPDGTEHRKSLNLSGWFGVRLASGLSRNCELWCLPKTIINLIAITYNFIAIHAQVIWILAGISNENVETSFEKIAWFRKLLERGKVWKSPSYQYNAKNDKQTDLPTQQICQLK